MMNKQVFINSVNNLKSTTPAEKLIIEYFIKNDAQTVQDLCFCFLVSWHQWFPPLILMDTCHSN